MRSTILPFAMAAVIGSASMVFAATTTMGVIKSIDKKTHSITLADGTAYVLPKSFNFKSLKVGEKVDVVWTLKGTERDASKVTAA